MEFCVVWCGLYWSRIRWEGAGGRASVRVADRRVVAGVRIDKDDRWATIAVHQATGTRNIHCSVMLYTRRCLRSKRFTESWEYEVSKYEGGRSTRVFEKYCTHFEIE